MVGSSRENWRNFPQLFSCFYFIWFDLAFGQWYYFVKTTGYKVKLWQKIETFSRNSKYYDEILLILKYIYIKSWCKNGLGVGLHSYVFIIQDGDPAPARTKYLHSSSLVIQHNSDWESSDEEKFLENLNLDSDQEEDNSSS